MKKLLYLSLALSVLLWPILLRADEVYFGWEARFQGQGLDKANDLAVDALGNVYVAGVINNISQNGNYGLAKYDRDFGQLIWFRQYNGPGNGYDEATAIALDGNGYVYVTGKSTRVNNGDFDYATLVYDSNGYPMDTLRYNYDAANSHDVATAIVAWHAPLSPDWIVYVTGYSWGGVAAREDYYTAQYWYCAEDSELYLMWEQRYDYQHGFYGDCAYDVAVDAEGNAYVTGTSWDNTSGRDFATLKYDGNTGEIVWEQRYSTGYGGSWGADAAFSIAVDANSNAYVVGGLTLYYGQGEYCDWGVVKYNASGDTAWTSIYNGPANGCDCARDVAVDASGNVYVTGYTDVLTGSNRQRYEFLTIKYNPSGTTVWTRQYSSASTNRVAGDRAAAIATDTDGNVYVSGTGVRSSPPDNDYVTLSYSPTGATRWVVRYNGPGNGEDSLGVANIGYQYAGYYPSFDNRDFHGHIVVKGGGQGDIHVTGSSDRLSGPHVNLDWATMKYLQLPPPAVPRMQALDDSKELPAVVPAAFSLENHPEPFNPRTTLSFTLPEAARVDLMVYDISGRTIASLVDGWRQAGTHEVTFDGSNLASGIYVYRLQAGEFNSLGKMVLMK